MPQLEQIDTYLSQVVWLVLTFGILYLILWRSALPRISQVLVTRQERIDGDLRKAAELKTEAETVLAAYEEAAAKARAEAQAILRESADRFAAEAAERNESLTAQLAGEAAAGEPHRGSAGTGDGGVQSSRSSSRGLPPAPDRNGTTGRRRNSVGQVIREPVMLSTTGIWVRGFVIFIAGGGPAWPGRPGARKKAESRRLDEAQTLHEEAQHLLAEYQRKQRDAAREAAQTIEQARSEAERLRADALENLERTIERRKAAAGEKISQAEADAVRAVRHAAVDIAIAATARVIGERLGEDRASVLIDDAVKDLPRHLN